MFNYQRVPTRLLIQQQDLWVSQHCARDGAALPLPATQLFAPQPHSVRPVPHGLGFFWDGCCGHSVDFIGNPGVKTLIKTLEIADSGHLNGHVPIKPCFEGRLCWLESVILEVFHVQMSSVQNPSVSPFNPGWFIGLPLLGAYNPQYIE